MSSWVRSGAVCECIDQEWTNPFTDEEVPGPLLGERYVVAHHEVADGIHYLQVMGDEMFYESRAFRPVFDETSDVSLIKSLLTNSSARVRTVENAC